MAQSLKLLSNGLRVKFLKRPQRYFLFKGNFRIKIDGKYQQGFTDFEKIKDFGEKLTHYSGINYISTLK